MSRLLLLAPDCDGTDVGEAWVTMQWVRELSSRHETTVLVQRKLDRDPIAPQVPAARVVEWQQPPLVGKHERLNSMLKPAYGIYHHRAKKWIARALAQGEHFDLAHQICPVSLRYPSPLSSFEIPYVIGPVGGSLSSPSAFVPEEREAPWFVGLRKFDALRLKRDPWLRRSFGDAALVLGIAAYVRELLSDIDLRWFESLSDTGIVTMPPAQSRENRDGPVSLLFVGRVIRTKGVRDAIRAVAQVRADCDVHLHVVGDGYDRPTCEEIAVSLGVGSRVTFYGRVPSREVGRHYAAADVFLFPSYREPGGIVLSEAMSWGLPSIVCHAGGPGATIDEATGIRVAAIDPGQYSNDLARAIETLAEDPLRRLSMGQQARSIAESRLLWSRKADELEGLYRRVLDLHGTDPHRA